MKKLHLKMCWKLFIANICSFIGFFILDVLLFNVENIKFTAFYGYFLFPLFSIACGIMSYKKIKQVVLSNVLYFAFCFLFINVFTVIGIYFQNDYYRLAISPAFKRALYSMPIVGLCTMISVLFSVVISIIVSLITKGICNDENTQKLGDVFISNNSNTGDE